MVREDPGRQPQTAVGHRQGRHGQGGKHHPFSEDPVVVAARPQEEYGMQPYTH